MSDSTDVQDPRPCPPKRPWLVKAIPVLILLVVAYLWFPRSMPDYIRLPAAHGPVEVKSWLILPCYRQYYVKTRVSQPWQSVLQELGQTQDVFIPSVASRNAGELRMENREWRTPQVPLVDQNHSGGAIQERRSDSTTTGRIICNWGAKNFIDWRSQSQSMPESDRDPGIESSAIRSARPHRHGGYGDPLPSSYVVFRDPGPDDEGSQHHILFYRLTDHSGTETTLEVWDNRFYNH